MISTHILDTAKGIPASGVVAILMRNDGNSWVTVSQGTTNSDGRVAFDGQAKSGLHQILFVVEPYLKNLTPSPFYREIPVQFYVDDASKKFHIPLLLSPFGYSTYRGS